MINISGFEYDQSSLDYKESIKTVEIGLRKLRFDYYTNAARYIKNNFSKDIDSNEFDRILLAFINERDFNFKQLFIFLKQTYGNDKIYEFINWFSEKHVDDSWMIKQNFIKDFKEFFLNLSCKQKIEFDLSRLTFKSVELNMYLTTIQQKSYRFYYIRVLIYLIYEEWNKINYILKLFIKITFFLILILFLFYFLILRPNFPMP